MKRRFPSLRHLARPRPLLLFGLLGTLLSGCALHPQQVAPTGKVPIPTEYSHLPAPTGAGVPMGEVKTPVTAAAAAPAELKPRELREWWRLLGDPELDRLIDRALANNPELHMASARIQQGWIRTQQVHDQRFPVLSAGYQAIAQRPNSSGSSVGAITPSNTTTYHEMQLSLSLKPDLWGEQGALEESARLQAWRLGFAREDARRTLVANCVSLYIDYLSLNDRLHIAQQTHTLLNEMLVSVKGRMEKGDATMTDYEQQRAAVFSVAATLPVLELQRQTAANAIASLLGVTPSAMALPDDRGLDSLKFPEVTPGAPAQLLLRRPDVHAAELRLMSANADIAVARARLLPGLDLTAQTGYGAQYLSQLVSPAGFYWNAIASISGTVFDHGARDDAVQYAAAVQEELTESYVQTLYGAIRETEDAAAGIHYNDRRLSDQRIANEASRNAWRNSSEAYAAGAIDYLTLLETQRTYFSNLDTLAGAQRDRGKSLVSLFAALGGGTTIRPEGEPVDANDPAAAVPAADTDQTEAGAAAKTIDDGPWLVALPGLQDNDGVRRIGADLRHRFPEQMNRHPLVAHQFGNQGDMQTLQITWSHVFVTRFNSQGEAQDFCAALTAQLQRCQPMATSEPGFSIGTRQAAINAISQD